MDNDITFKRTFSHHVMVRHLLDWFVGELQDGGRELVDRLDLAKLRRLNEQTVGGRPASLHRFAGDMVWTAPFAESPDPDPGAWLDLVLLSEFQRRPDRLMPLRVRNYVDCHHLDAWRQRDRHFGVKDRLQPALPIVIYSGRGRWNAPQRVMDLVTPGSAPAPPNDLSSRRSGLFAGDGYLLLDIHRLGADDFRDDNAVSLLAELTDPPPTPRTARLAANLLEVLAGEQLELRRVLFEWIRQESGLDLGVHEMERVERLDAAAREDFLEDRVELWCDRLHAEGVETGRAEGAETGRAEGFEIGRAEGIETGRAEERELLVRQAELKFDSPTARRLAEILSRTDNPASLAEVGAWIITCTTAEDLLARAAQSRRNP